MRTISRGNSETTRKKGRKKPAEGRNIISTLRDYRFFMRIQDPVERGAREGAHDRSTSARMRRTA